MEEQLKGEDSLFYIKYNNVWCPIACETSNSFSESVEMMNTTTRDNGGWKTEIPTIQSYSISLEAVLRIDDATTNSNVLSYNKIRQMKRNRELIEWQRVTGDNLYVDEGKAYITDIGDSNAVGEYITFSLTLNGFGMPQGMNAREKSKTYDFTTVTGHYVFAKKFKIPEATSEWELKFIVKKTTSPTVIEEWTVANGKLTRLNAQTWEIPPHTETLSEGDYIYTACYIIGTAEIVAFSGRITVKTHI